MSGSPSLTVLHLVSNRWWTGSAEPALRLVSALRDRGHRALLAIIPGERFEQKAREAGIEPVSGLALDVGFRPLRLLAGLARLRSLVRSEGVDVIHCHHSHDHWLGGLGRGGAALVRTFHNARAVRSGWPSSALYRRTDAAIAVSREIEERCLRAGFPPARLHRVAGVVEVARFRGTGDGAAVRKEFGIAAGPVLGSVARLAPNRGHELLIQGFRLLLPRHPGARLLLVGKGEARPRLEALVRELGLTERVLFTGYRDADLPDVLQAVDVFVLMGAGSDESCRAALEAMAAGRPVVARRVGALPDTVVDGVTGLLVEGEEPDAVAAALHTLLTEPSLAQRMGRSGRRRVEEIFSPERHAETIEAVYRAALAGRTPVA
ncbi:MAG TPA: glycosyltransferase family 4 protein [Methylomirabilota bacterium]|nr:glycosyltransferase family 4 protein [Methylomirabilota bacterium]